MNLDERRDMATLFMILLNVRKRNPSLPHKGKAKTKQKAKDRPTKLGYAKKAHRTVSPILYKWFCNILALFYNYDRHHNFTPQ